MLNYLINRKLEPFHILHSDFLKIFPVKGVAFSELDNCLHMDKKYISLRGLHKKNNNISVEKAGE